jgi:hypothetical protein
MNPEHELSLGPLPVCFVERGSLPISQAGLENPATPDSSGLHKSEPHDACASVLFRLTGSTRKMFCGVMLFRKPPGLPQIPGDFHLC